MIPAGVLPQIVDTPIRGRPSGSLFFVSGFKLEVRQEREEEPRDCRGGRGVLRHQQTCHGAGGVGLGRQGKNRVEKFDDLAASLFLEGDPDRFFIS